MMVLFILFDNNIDSFHDKILSEGKFILTTHSFTRYLNISKQFLNSSPPSCRSCRIVVSIFTTTTFSFKICFFVPMKVMMSKEWHQRYGTKYHKASPTREPIFGNCLLHSVIPH